MNDSEIRRACLGAAINIAQIGGQARNTDAAKLVADATEIYNWMSKAPATDSVDKLTEG